MKNEQTSIKRKNIISLTLSIIGVIVCLIFIIILMIPRAKNDEPKPEISRVYWTIELEFYAYYTELPLLKRVSLNGDEEITRIESINPSATNLREDHFYKRGKLDRKVTYSVEPISYMGKDFADTELYETRYTYKGGVISKAEVYVNGVPTRSYDKYFYTASGELDRIEKYEKGKLESTYFYNGKTLPERAEYVNGKAYDLEYDKNGNLVRVTGENYLIEIDYENGRPLRFYKVICENGRGEAPRVKYETIKTFSYGERGEITGETVESVSTGVMETGEETLISSGVTDHVYSYDSEGRLIGQKIYKNDKFLYGIDYTYDADGNIASSVESYNESTDRNNERIVKRTNENGIKVEMTYSLSNDVKSIEVYKYDKDGDLVKFSHILPDGSVITDRTYEYYPSGATKKIMAVQGRTSETWLYAENGNIEKYILNDYDSDKNDVTREFLQSEVYYGFRRSEGFAITFELVIAEKTSKTTSQYVYREDLTLEKRTIYYSASGNYRVYEYDENGALLTDIEYDANGNVFAQYYPAKG